MRSLILSASLILLLLLGACGNFVYQPVTMITPNHEKQNDLSVQLNAAQAGGEIYGSYEEGDEKLGYVGDDGKLYLLDEDGQEDYVGQVQRTGQNQ